MAKILDCDTLHATRARIQSLRKIIEKSTLTEQAEALATLDTEMAEQVFAVGIVGQAKRGKSTLINGILGRDNDAVAPVGRFPATNVVSWFGHAEREEVQVTYYDSGKPQQKITYSDIRQFACEDGNKDNVKGVKSIAIAGPFPGLQPKVFLVDTPGAGNALTHAHDEILLNILPKLDAIVFLVTADSPVDQDEIELLKRIRGQEVKKVFFAINKTDLCDAKEREEGLAANRRALAAVGYGDAPVFEISAKTYLEKKSDEGTNCLIQGIRDLISNERMAILQQRANDRLAKLHTEIEGELAARVVDSERSTTELEQEKRAVQEATRKLSANKHRLEAEFRAAWGDALTNYERVLPRLRQELMQSYGEVIEQTGAMKLEALGKMVQTDIALKIQEILQPHASDLEKRLSAAISELGHGTASYIPIRSDVNAPEVWTHNDRLRNCADIASAAGPGIATAILATIIPTLIAQSGSGVIGTILAGGAALIAGPIAWTIGGAGAIIGIWKGWNEYQSIQQKSKNVIHLRMSQAITDCFDQLRINISELRRKESEIAARYFATVESKLAESETRLADLAAKKIPPTVIEGWKDTLDAVRKWAAPAVQVGQSSRPNQPRFALGNFLE